MNLVPFMTKRIVKTKNIQIFKRYISKRYNGTFSSLTEDPEAAKQIQALSPGCFIFVYETGNGMIEAISMHKFEYALSSMINRELAYNFQMRYLSKEERAESTAMLDAEDKSDISRCVEEEKNWLNN